MKMASAPSASGAEARDNAGRVAGEDGGPDSNPWDDDRADDRAQPVAGEGSLNRARADDEVGGEDFGAEAEEVAQGIAAEGADLIPDPERGRAHRDVVVDDVPEVLVAV